MRKLFLILGFLCFCVLNTYSQQFFSLWEKNPEKPNFGLKSTTFIQAKISTPKNAKMKDMIKVFKDFYMESRFISKKNYQFVGSENNYKIDEISDDMAEIKLLFAFRQNMTTIKYMGAVSPQPPVVMGFDAVFTFDEQHNLCISFTNFQEAAFFFLENGKYTTKELTDPIFEPYNEILATIMVTETTIGKILIAANSGLSNYKSNMAALNASLDEQHEVYDTYVKKGLAKWLDSEMMVDAYPDSKINFIDYPAFRKLADQKVKDGYLLIVDNGRFNNYFKDILINSFKENAMLAKGKILSISKDDKVIYERVGDLVLPTDPKERVKWQKGKKSL